jgi:hypothetical protein
MMRPASCALVSLVLAGAIAGSVVTGAAQPLSYRICMAAQEYLARTRTPLGEDMLLWSDSLSKYDVWGQLVRDSTNSVGRDVHTVYLAYLFRGEGFRFEPAGAVSIKMSVIQAPGTTKTPVIELYRPAIDRGTNRCERRGRPVFENQQIRINEYIDYHDRRGSSSTLENFHFRYPFGVNGCAATDQPEVIQTFQFPDVSPTSGDTLISRLFGSGQAYALNHTFSKLRSELHYYQNATAPTPICVGFSIPLNAVSKNASILIHDIFANSGSWYSARGMWLIKRQ